MQRPSDGGWDIPTALRYSSPQSQEIRFPNHKELSESLIVRLENPGRRSRSIGSHEGQSAVANVAQLPLRGIEVNVGASNYIVSPTKAAPQNGVVVQTEHCTAWCTYELFLVVESALCFVFGGVILVATLKLRRCRLGP